ncbi:TNase-like domain-containing protein [Entamoeba marina]
MPSQTNKTQKKDSSKKVTQKEEHKDEIKETKKISFVAHVKKVISGDRFVIQQKNKPEETVSLAHVIAPRLYKEKEEKYFFESMNFLRKKIIGKEVKLVVQNVSNYNNQKRVIPFAAKENILLTMISEGYVFLTQKHGEGMQNYIAAAKKAEEQKKGFHNGTNAIKKPERVHFNEKELKDMVGKTFTGYISRVSAPSEYVITTPERKEVNVKLFGVNQMLSFDSKNNRYIFDEDGTDAMKYINKLYFQRDVTVKVIKYQKSIYALIQVEKKEINEELLKNGFVVLRQKDDSYTEEIKQRFEKAEKIAKKGKLARWTDFDQAIEDEIIAKRLKVAKDLEDRKNNAEVFQGEVESISHGFIRVKKGKEVVRVNFASVLAIKSKDEALNTISSFRYREAIRKIVAGKKVECKQAYKFEEVVDGKDFVKNYYDVYVNKKNIAVQLLEQGVVKFNANQNPFKQSFDYKLLQNTKAGELNTKEIKEYRDVIDKDKVKNLFLNNEFKAVVVAVITPIRYLVYIPEKDCQLVVSLMHCKLPFKDISQEFKEFNNQSKQTIRQLIGFSEVTVDFQEYYKGNFQVEIRFNRIHLSDYVLTNAMAMVIGRNVVHEAAEDAKDTGKGVYKFATTTSNEKQPKTFEKRERKPREEAVKFNAERKAFISGFDGSKIYFYDNAEQLKKIDELSSKMKTVKKGQVKEQDGVKCIVDYKNKLYRAQIIRAVPTANEVKCIDTGVLVICGKNRLRPITSEFESIEFPINSVGLVGIDTLKQSDVDFTSMCNAVSEFYGSEAVIETTGTEIPLARITVGDVCINTTLLSKGLSTLTKYFKDQTKWGTEMIAAQDEAKENHLSIWRYGEIQDEEETKPSQQKPKSQKK